MSWIVEQTMNETAGDVRGICSIFEFKRRQLPRWWGIRERSNGRKKLSGNLREEISR